MNVFRKWGIWGLCFFAISMCLQGQVIEKVEKEKKIGPKDIFQIRLAVPNGWWLDLDRKGAGELRGPVNSSNREFFQFKERSLRFKEILETLGEGLSATSKNADDVNLIFDLQDGRRLMFYTADVGAIRGFFEKCGANVEPKRKAAFDAALAKDPYFPVAAAKAAKPSEGR